MALTCRGVDGVACGQDRVVTASMAVCRADVTDAAVEVRGVVPTHEVSRPGASVCSINEALGGELRAVFCSPEQGLRIWIGASSQLRLLGPSSDDLFG